MRTTPRNHIVSVLTDQPEDTCVVGGNWSRGSTWSRHTLDDGLANDFLVHRNKAGLIESIEEVEAEPQIMFGGRPYSGSGDSSLPANVKKMSAKKRRQWVHVFNSTYKDHGESRAFAAANSAVKDD